MYFWSQLAAPLAHDAPFDGIDIPVNGKFTKNFEAGPVYERGLLVPPVAAVPFTPITIPVSPVLYVPVKPVRMDTQTIPEGPYIVLHSDDPEFIVGE